MRLIGFAFSLGPILFGLGFLAPVITASLAIAGVGNPLGINSLTFGLIVGGLLGLIARQRKTWLW